MKAFLASLRLGALLALGAVSLIGCGSDRGTGSDPGTCSMECSTGATCCVSGGVELCVNPLADPNHCGGCGIACAGACVSGTCSGGPVGGDGSVTSDCSPMCSSAQRCCGTSCVNRVGTASAGDGDSSFANCNGCGLSCDTSRATHCGTLSAGGPSTCMCGDFAQCPPGQVCSNAGGSYLCADLNTDPNNCGAVGNACNTGESCVAGTCGCGASGACAAGQGCCAGACVDVTSDASNCGACGTVCGAEAPNCNGGSCGCGTGGACALPVAGVFGMGGSPGESCCGGSCVPNTDSSCLCAPCTGGDTCQIGGDLLGMGGAVEVCCGDSTVAFLGCGGGGVPGLDGGLGGDGGLPFP